MKGTPNLDDWVLRRREGAQRQTHREENTMKTCAQAEGRVRVESGVGRMHLEAKELQGHPAAPESEPEAQSAPAPPTPQSLARSADGPSDTPILHL